MKNKISIHSKIASGIVFFTIYLTFVLLFISATPAKATDSAQEAKTEQTEQITSDYTEIEPPITEEQISAFISFLIVLFGWLMRFIEKRKIKRQLKRQLKEVATSTKKISETEFSETIEKI
jgi:hypothetical protein